MGATNSLGQLTTYREAALNKQKAMDLEANRAKVPPPPSAPYWSDEIAKPPTPPIKSVQAKEFSNPVPSGPFGSSFDIGKELSRYKPYRMEIGPSGTPIKVEEETPPTRMAGQIQPFLQA